MLPPERSHTFTFAAALPTRARRALANPLRPGQNLRGVFPYTNLILSSLILAVLLASSGPLSGTWAFFTVQRALASNAVGTAKLFAPTDATAVPKAGGA